MPITSNCSVCKGAGRIYALVNAHDDKKEWCECPKCHGSGKIHEMTQDEEMDYYAGY